MPDENPAESSPVENKEAAASVDTSQGEDVSIFGEPNPEQTAVDEKAAESSPVEKPDSETEAKADVEEESVSSSEDAERSEEEQPPRESKAEKRIKQLTAQVKALERQMEDRQKEADQPKPLMKEPKKPLLDEFDNIEAFNQALDKFDKEVRSYAVELDRVQQQALAEQEAVRKVQQEAKAAWDKRMAVLAKDNPEFDTLKAIRVVQPNSTTDAFLAESEIGPHVLHYLNENPDEADSIRALTPFATVRHLIRLEQKLSDQIKGIKKQDRPHQEVKPPPMTKGKPASPSVPKSAADILYG